MNGEILREDGVFVLGCGGAGGSWREMGWEEEVVSVFFVVFGSSILDLDN